MPTVLRVDGFRVVILFPPREHGPAHVHVINADGVAVIYLASSDVAQFTERVEGMKRSDARTAERIARDNTPYLLEEWGKIHGDD
jgi:hypothetical protein